MHTENLLLNVDSYKLSHWLQYPEGTEYVSSYIESRGGKFDKSVFFGLQMFLKEYLSKPISHQDIDEAEEFAKLHGVPFNRPAWEYIINKHRGFLPLCIQAVPEGTVLPVRNVLVQVVNTDPNCFWLTSYMETALLRAVWYPTTVATNSKEAKNIIWKSLEKTADAPEAEIGFKMHDFGARGTTSLEAAGIGGAAHLVNFLGTDTISGILWANKYYNAGVCGFSIPASEHSTMTTWGNEPGEVDAMRNMIEKFGGEGKLFACVSDSYDIFKAVTDKWGGELKELVMENGGTLVVRPDSGDPVDTPVKVIQLLMDKFGYTVNSKGYKVLPDYVRVIQGDGITYETIAKILRFMEWQGLSASNIAFGQGAGLLQKVDRDTMKFAMKTSAICVNGEWRDVYKQPLNQSDKNSKRGRLALVGGGRTLVTIREREVLSEADNELRVVWENGKLLVDDDFETIRNRSNA